jgi:hypothetical protein
MLGQRPIDVLFKPQTTESGPLVSATKLDRVAVERRITQFCGMSSSRSLRARSEASVRARSRCRAIHLWNCLRRLWLVITRLPNEKSPHGGGLLAETGTTPLT